MAPKLGLTLPVTPCWFQGLACPWPWPSPVLGGSQWGGGGPHPAWKMLPGWRPAVVKFALFTSLFCSDTFARSLCWVRLSLPGQAPTRLPGAHPTSPPASPVTASWVPALRTHHLALSCQSPPYASSHTFITRFPDAPALAGSRAAPYRSCPSYSLRPEASHLNARAVSLAPPPGSPLTLLPAAVTPMLVSSVLNPGEPIHFEIPVSWTGSPLSWAPGSEVDQKQALPCACGWGMESKSTRDNPGPGPERCLQKEWQPRALLGQAEADW